MLGEREVRLYAMIPSLSLPHTHTLSLPTCSHHFACQVLMSRQLPALDKEVLVWIK